MVSDKLSLGNKSVATSDFPYMKGWTSKLLRSRETEEKQLGKKAIRNAASGAAIGTSDPSSIHAHVPADTITTAPANEADVAHDPNKSMHTLMEAARTAVRALGNLITKLNEMPIDVKNRDCFKIAATTALKMIGFQEKDRNEDVDPIGSMTQTLMDEDEEWKDPSWVEAVEDMVTTVEKRVALCDNDGIPSFDLGIEWVSNSETHADDNEDNIMRMKSLEKGKNIMENTAEDNLNS